MLRGLRHFWKINLAVLLAAAVNTAVLAGALSGTAQRHTLPALRAPAPALPLVVVVGSCGGGVGGFGHECL